MVIERLLILLKHDPHSTLDFKLTLLAFGIILAKRLIHRRILGKKQHVLEVQDEVVDRVHQ